MTADEKNWGSGIEIAIFDIAFILGPQLYCKQRATSLRDDIEMSHIMHIVKIITLP